MSWKFTPTLSHRPTSTFLTQEFAAHYGHRPAFHSRIDDPVHPTLVPCIQFDSSA